MTITFLAVTQWLHTRKSFAHLQCLLVQSCWTDVTLVSLRPWHPAHWPVQSASQRAAQYRISCTPLQQRTAHMHKTILLGRTLHYWNVLHYQVMIRSSVCTEMQRRASSDNLPDDRHGQGGGCLILSNCVLHALPTVKCSFCIGQCTQHSATQFCTITLLFSIKRKQCNSRFWPKDGIRPIQSKSPIGLKTVQCPSFEHFLFYDHY